MFVSICGNLQHMTKHKIFKVVFLLPYTSAMMQNAAKISYTNFRVTFMLKKKRRSLKFNNNYLTCTNVSLTVSSLMVIG